MNPRVIKVIPQKDFHIKLRFDNGEDKLFDVRPYLNKGIFKELQEFSQFNSVKVVDGTIQWQNEADFCPDMLYLDSVAC